MAIAVGQDLFALCGKCGPTYHVIGAMDGAKVSKVQCKQCLGYHRYKPAPGEKNVNAGIAKSRKIVPTGRGSKRPLPPGAPVVEADPDRPPRPYAIKETFKAGDRVDHPKFGRGVVEATPDPGKMLVCFPDGRRTLAHDR